MPCCGIYAFDVCTRRALGDTEASKAVIQISQSSTSDYDHLWNEHCMRLEGRGYQRDQYK